MRIHVLRCLKQQIKLRKTAIPAATSIHLRIYRLVVVVIADAAFAVIMHGLRSNVAQPINIK